ncbi:A-kinase anchor protein 14-like [Agrilus planipennis]|uniref:A-kinase anchor protein 14-like n=1 Tax=Agrilus planipennis TaxID=224129 RepID=A0A1W4WPI1_AGRPL|nr:A-kinase anchor protein 14-like [Agrilus planipennis]
MACHKLPPFEDEKENDNALPVSPENDSNITGNEKEQGSSVDYEEYEIEATINGEEENLEEDGIIEEKCCLEEVESNRCNTEIDRRACISYADKETFAHHLIECTLRKVLKTVYSMNLLNESFFSDQSVRSSVFDLKLTKNFNRREKITDIEEVIYYFKWPTIAEFSCQLIEKKIEEYMKTWHLTEDWRYCIKLVGQDCVNKMNRYHYAVIWSLPNKCYPVPQVEARVFFTIVIRNDIPTCCPVEVCYRFEGNSHYHVPGRIQFKEQWLLDILYAKLKVYSSVNF